MNSIRSKISLILVLLAGTFILVVGHLIVVRTISQSLSNQLQTVSLTKLNNANALLLSYGLLNSLLETSMRSGQSSFFTQNAPAVIRFNTELQAIANTHSLSPEETRLVSIARKAGDRLLANASLYTEEVRRRGLRSPLALEFDLLIRQDQQSLDRLVPKIRQQAIIGFRESITKMQTNTSQANFLMAVSLAILFLAATLIAQRTLKSMMKQIHVLGNQLKNLAADDLKMISPVNVDDEIAVFTDGVNSLISTIQEYQSDLVDKNFVEMIIESLNDYLFVLQPNGKLMRVNKKVEDELGYTWNELSTMHINKVLSGEQSALNPTGFLAVLSEEIQSANAKLVLKDRSELDILLSSGIIRKDGQPLAIVCIAKDVSELKAAIIEREKLVTKLSHTSKMASLGTMGAGVAHELNNPLAAVKGFSQLLATKETEPDKIKATAQKILLASERMSKIIDHLRKFARISSEDDWKPVNMTEVLENTLMIIGRQLETRDIEVCLACEEPIPLIMGDSMELESIFHNLLSNSRDAFKTVTDRDKKVSIRIKSANQGEQLEIFYQDNACGIKDSDLTKIFDPFFTTKDVGEGTGLGMSIVYDLIEQHSGSIEIESKKNEGTMFYMQFPAIVTPSSSTDKASIAAPSSQKADHQINSGIRALIVDDEPFILDILAEFLEDQFHVTVFDDPRQAIAAMHEDAFDLVISDLRMPQITGTGVLQAARMKMPQATTIIMTGQSEDEPEVVEALETVADAVLSKPFSGPEAIIATILDLLKKNRIAA